MSNICLWLLGCGASKANGLSWVVPPKWKDELINGRIRREEHINLIIEAIRKEMCEPSVRCKPYNKLLNFMNERTVDGGHHKLVTTNWDYLLQLEIDAWINANQPGQTPRFLSNSYVFHLNGTAEPGESSNRSPFLLETDSAGYRKQSLETNLVFNSILWSTLVVIVGMSFECDIDKGLLAALRTHEDKVPIGEALFVVIDPCEQNLGKIGMKLHQCFPMSRQQLVSKKFEKWIDSDMPELIDHIFTPPSNNQLLLTPKR